MVLETSVYADLTIFNVILWNILQSTEWVYQVGNSFPGDASVLPSYGTGTYSLCYMVAVKGMVLVAQAPVMGAPNLPIRLCENL